MARRSQPSGKAIAMWTLIFVSIQRSARRFQNISDTYMLSPITGARVPVNAMASLSPQWHPGRIVRRNGVRTLTVRAFPDGGRLGSQILTDAKKQIGNLQLPQGYRIEYGGEDENQRETFGEMRVALGISLVLIFLILLLQFRKLSDALIVMAAFPLALPGAALGLFITHNPFGFTAFIGVISLGGLVVRNSIILVDYIHERMKHGVGLEEATLEAGERRLRPIFLTTMAAAVGVTPMILSRSSMWSPLASVIAFGLLGSMFFTLVVIPVLFVVVNTKKVSKPAMAVAASVAPRDCDSPLPARPSNRWSPTTALLRRRRSGAPSLWMKHCNWRRNRTPRSASPNRRPGRLTLKLFRPERITFRPPRMRPTRCTLGKPSF